MSRTHARRRRTVAGDRSYVRVVMLRDGEELARWWLLVRPHDELAAADTLAKVFMAARRRGGSVALEGASSPPCVRSSGSSAWPSPCRTSG